MHRAAERGAVAALVPWRQLQIARPLGQTRVDRRECRVGGLGGSSTAPLHRGQRGGGLHPPTRRCGATSRGREHPVVPWGWRGCEHGVDVGALQRPEIVGGRDEGLPPGLLGDRVPDQLGVGPFGAVVGGCLRGPVDRHHEMVTSARHGDVEEPQLLLEVHLLVDGCVPLELLGGDARRHAHRVRVVVVREQELHAAGATRGLGGHARHDRDGELEPLGAVDGEDAHRVVVGLGQHGLDDPRALAARQRGPGEEVAHAAALGVGERPCLLHHEADPPPQVARAPVGEPDLEHVPLTHDAVEQLARR